MPELFGCLIYDGRHPSFHIFWELEAKISPVVGLDGYFPNVPIGDILIYALRQKRCSPDGIELFSFFVESLLLGYLEMFFHYRINILS